MVPGRESSAVSAKPIESAIVDGLYERDFALWCEEMARLLRARRFAEIDAENVAEEIEAMAGTQRRELRNRLRVLLIHLLKWEWQPEKRGRSWQSTINNQRTQLRDLFWQSPSLRPKLAEAILEIYSQAVEEASSQTGLPEDVFPSLCSYAPDQILDRNFLPEARRRS